MPRERTNLALDYTQRRIWVSSENIGTEFQRSVTKRKIRESAVRKLVRVLEAKGSFPPLTVNLIRNRYEIIDGNHRIEAIRRYLEAHPEHKVELEMEVFVGLSEAECKKVYNNHADIVRQTTSDLIQQNEADIPIYTMIKREFPLPITTYKTANSMPFYTLISAYFGAIQPNFQGGYSGSALGFLERSKALGGDDYRILKAFCKDWKEIFVSVKDNPFARVTPLCVTMRIWFDNKGQIPQPQMIRFFKTRIVNSFPVRENLKQSGRGAGLFLWTLFIDQLNAGNRQNHIFTKRIAEVVGDQNGQEEEDSEE